MKLKPTDYLRLLNNKIPFHNNNHLTQWRLPSYNYSPNFKILPPSLNIPYVGNGKRFRCWKRPPVTLYGGLSRYQPRNLLSFPTWGILRHGVDSCNLECTCSCNSVMFIKCSDHYERESIYLAIVNKPCALISNLQ